MNGQVFIDVWIPAKVVVTKVGALSPLDSTVQIPLKHGGHDSALRRSFIMAIITRTPSDKVQLQQTSANI